MTDLVPRRKYLSETDRLEIAATKTMTEAERNQVLEEAAKEVFETYFATYSTPKQGDLTLAHAWLIVGRIRALKTPEKETK